MIKVLVISSKLPPEYSGSGNRIFETYERLEKKYKINASFVSSSTVKNYNHTYNYKNKKIKCISNKIFKAYESKNIFIKLYNYFIFRLNYLYELIPIFLFLFKNYKKFDLFHIIGNVNVTNLSITFCKIFKIPNLVEIVNDRDNSYYYEPSLVRFFWGNGFPNLSIISVISKKLFKIYKKNTINNIIWHKPNPIKPIFVNKKIKKLKIFKKNIKILHLAKFIPRKKQDFLIEVLKDLPNEYSLILAGPLEKKGSYSKRDIMYFKNLKNNIIKNKLQKRVKIFSKYIKNPEVFINTCDIFTLPSINEGLGTTILEATTLNKPIICNNLKDIFDTWIKDNKNGYLCELDKEIWVKKILSIRNLKKKVIKNYGIKNYKIANVEKIDSQYLKYFSKLKQYDQKNYRVY